MFQDKAIPLPGPSRGATPLPSFSPKTKEEFIELSKCLAVDVDMSLAKEAARLWKTLNDAGKYSSLAYFSALRDYSRDKAWAMLQNPAAWKNKTENDARTEFVTLPIEKIEAAEKALKATKLPSDDSVKLYMAECMMAADQAKELMLHLLKPKK